MRSGIGSAKRVAKGRPVREVGNGISYLQGQKQSVGQGRTKKRDQIQSMNKTAEALQQRLSNSAPQRGGSKAPMIPKEKLEKVAPNARATVGKKIMKNGGLNKNIEKLVKRKLAQMQR